MPKEKYSELQKKYNLPDFNSLNTDFDLEDIEGETAILLSRVRVKMHEKIDFYAKTIENMLQPESSLADMYEAHYVEDDDKSSAYALFKKLMKLIRMSTFIAITNKEEENAEFIKTAFKEWESSKKEIKKLLQHLIDLWGMETDIKEDLNYFG
ncbi:MAG: hypothetical protein HGA85_05390 [Nanoarchaeota archaeon]|nr:hypothetical protein [Nanoarchaeota archaeon]